MLDLFVQNCLFDENIFKVMMNLFKGDDGLEFLLDACKIM